MREDEEQVPEPELLDDSALEGITGGVAPLPGGVTDPTNAGRSITKTAPPPPPKPFETDG
jgi:hypothetical protein